MLYTILIILAIIALVLFILGRAQRLTQPNSKQELTMSLNLSALPSMPTLDTSSLPLPSVAEVGDVIVTALDTAGDAATVVVASARRRPAMAVGIVSAAVLAAARACCSSGAAGTTRATAVRSEQPPRIVAA